MIRAKKPLSPTTLVRLKHFVKRLYGGRLVGWMLLQSAKKADGLGVGILIVYTVNLPCCCSHVPLLLLLLLMLLLLICQHGFLGAVPDERFEM